MKYFVMVVLVTGQMVLAQSTALLSLVEAERSFAAMSQREGIRNAFVANLADDAVIFRPGPINGKEFWEKRGPSSATLDWYPTYADIAESGELGYTMGPSVFTPSPDLDQPPHYGYFFSLWKRSETGPWKVALDGGIGTPAPEERDTIVEFAKTSADQQSMFGFKDTPVLLQLERNFSTLAEKRGMATAYSRYLASDARMMRDGLFPFIGSSAINTQLKKVDAKLSWVPIGSRVANSLDLGYTYGTYRLRRVRVEEEGHYIHIWKKQPNGAWKVVLDAFQPLPKE